MLKNLSAKCDECQGRVPPGDLIWTFRLTVERASFVANVKICLSDQNRPAKDGLIYVC